MRTGTISPFIHKHIWGAIGIVLVLIGMAAWLPLSRPVGLNVVWIGLIFVTVDLVRYHLYLGGVVAICLAFFFGFLAGEWAAEPYEIVTPREYFEQYCLFTWQNHSGDLCFKLMLRLDRAAFIHKWNSKWGARCGISDLKQALSALPANTDVAWENWPRRFTYPPEDVTHDVMEFAKSRDIHLELLPVTDKPIFPEPKNMRN
jgi:hypothetical protein